MNIVYSEEVVDLVIPSENLQDQANKGLNGDGNPQPGTGPLKLKFVFCLPVII